MAAMDRACQLIEELGAGEVVGGAVDVYPNSKIKQIRPSINEVVQELNRPFRWKQMYPKKKS